MLVVRPTLLYQTLASVAYLRNRLGVAQLLLRVVADGARHRVFRLWCMPGCVCVCARAHAEVCDHACERGRDSVGEATMDRGVGPRNSRRSHALGR